MRKVNESVQNKSVSVSTASVNVMGNVRMDSERVQLVITNTSATQTITIAIGDFAAVAGVGIKLPPNGVYAESTDNYFVCWQGNIQAISDAAGGTLGVVERVRVE